MEAKPDSAAGQRIWKVGSLTYGTAGLAAVFLWLLWGDFAWSLKERAVPAIVQLLLRKFEASDLVVGIFVGALPQAVWIILGPIVSYRSDRHRGRWGRRIPYLLWTTPVAMFAIIGLALSPALAGWLNEAGGGFATPALLTVLTLGVFWTVFELATVAANSVFAGLINDVVPAQLIGRFFGLFRALSLIAGMVFNYWLFGKVESHYAPILIGLGLVYGIGFAVMCFKVREGTYPPPPEIPKDTVGWVASTRTYLRDCFTNSYYLWLYAAVAFSYMGLVAVSLFSVFFAKSVDISMDAFGKYLAFTYGISLVISYGLGAVADRFHPVRAGMVVLALTAAVDLWGGLFAVSAGGFVPVLVLQAVLAGAFMTVTASLPQRLLPRGRFAQFNSALEVCKNIGIMLVAPATGWLLDSTGRDYRYTYIVGFGFSLLGLFCLAMVYRRFRSLGGMAGYVAPEP